MKRRILFYASLVLVLTLGLVGSAIGGWWRSGAKVNRVNPVGSPTVHPPKIEIEFTETLSTSAAQDKIFLLDPPTPGYAYANGHTLTFMPQDGFRPSTHYSFRVETKSLKTEKGFRDAQVTGEFNTPGLQVLDKRPFYNVDSSTGSEKELVIELVFNAAVQPEALAKVLRLSVNTAPVTYHIETAGSADRLYLKLDRLPEPNSNIQMDQLAPLLCTRCTNAATGILNAKLSSPDRLPLELKEVRFDLQASGSRATLQFSLPVAKELLLRELKISPALPFKIDTEYLFAVVKADFRPGVTYTLSLPKGLRSTNGRELLQEAKHEITVKNFPVSLGFVDRGHLLPASGATQVLVKSVNVKKLRARVEKVYRNNLLHYLQTQNTYSNGSLAWEGDLAVPGYAANREQETALSLAKWQKQGYRGLLLVTLSPARQTKVNEEGDEEAAEEEGSGEERSYDEEGYDYGSGSFNGYSGPKKRWFLITDLGLTAKASGKDLWVQAVDLKTLQPSAGVRVQVLSNSSQEMQSGITDAQGRVVFKNYAEGPEQNIASMLLASHNQDFAFLNLADNALAQERFDAYGDPFSADQLDAFLTSDRGLYRPGDTVHFTAIVRTMSLELRPKLPPLRLRILDLQGKEVARIKGGANEEGMATFAFSKTAGLPTGSYEAELGLADDQVLSRASIKIEEFIPQKIKVDLQMPKAILQPGQDLTATAHARMLFGAAAPGLAVQGQVEWEPKTFKSAQFPAYDFSDQTRPYQGSHGDLAPGRTDAQGALSLTVPFPSQLRPPSMLTGRIYAEVLDDGGRPVAAYGEVQAHVYPHYFGMKVEDKDETSGTLRLKLAAVGQDGKALSLKTVPFSIRRKSWYSIFRRQHWRGQRWESSYYEETIVLKDVDLVDGKAEVSFTPPGDGEYTAFLGDADGPRAAQRFYRGQHGSGDLESAEKLSMEFVGGKPRPGEMAKLRIKAPFAGRLLLTIERERMLLTRYLDVPRGVSVHELPVDASWLPNAYAVGLLTRQATESQRELPLLSFGVAAVSVDTRSRALGLRWDVPSRVGTTGELLAKLNIQGAPGAKVVLAAVDEGILQVIGFESPDPHKHFYRKRGLTTKTWSTLRDILPEILRKESIGGDAEAALKRKHLNPVEAQRVKSFALYSGVLTADANGNVTWPVPLKGFQGQVRLMAITVKGNRFAGAERAVQVADEIALESYLPRFLAPLDTVKVPVTVFNQSKTTRNLEIHFKAQGAAMNQMVAVKALSLSPGGQGRLEFPIQALDGIGKATFEASAWDAGKRVALQMTELAVRPAATLVTAFSSGRLRPGDSVDLPVPRGWLKTGQKVRLYAGTNDLARFAKKLEQLLRYPHGCAEQLTSQVFPLLYFKDVSLLPGKDEEKRAKATRNVQMVVERLQAMQAPDGGINYWENPPDSDPYLTRFVGHFLLEAERLGYKPDQGMMERLKARLAEMPTNSYYWADHGGGPDGVADPYLLLTKALAGHADKQSMQALRDQQLKAMGPDDRCMLSLAFSETGDVASAKACLPERNSVMALGPYYYYGGSLASSNKTVALYLNALAAADPQSKDIGTLIDELAKRSGANDYFHTQETAWMLMGVARATSQDGTDVRVRWGVVGEEAHEVAGKRLDIQSDQSSGKTLRLSNTGNATVNYSLAAEGYPIQPPIGHSGNKIALRRLYRTKGGQALDLNKVTQGDTVVVTLEAELKEPMENLALVDLLPAGFEVDNPRLSSRGDLGFDPAPSFSPANVDFRDDRVILFTRAAQGTLSFSYTVRAVSPGEYQVPGALIEAMYDPTVYARADDGLHLLVRPKP